MHITDKVLIFKYTKRYSTNQLEETSSPIKKWAKNSSKHFIKLNPYDQSVLKGAQLHWSSVKYKLKQ